MCSWYKTNYSEFAVKTSFPISKKLGFNIDFGIVSLIENGYSATFFINKYPNNGACIGIFDVKSPSLSIYDGQSLYVVFGIG